eukprot:TRINITY_DN1687_c0_g1_i1.p1 TRINITY_DN1687_c0_g1~~TRINITY_DN1687_c0_g1_i1.p1  ORF type:complete len:188 (-),score=64.23 TRINITY_DN1687_c0_g1_i1:304-867(-)
MLSQAAKLTTRVCAPSSMVKACFARSYTVGANVINAAADAPLYDITGKKVNANDVFKGKKVVLFGLPGAFTPVCSSKHVPGFVQHSEAIKGKGVDDIVCVSINDHFVMKAWGASMNVAEKVTLLADPSGKFTKAIGMDTDLSDSAFHGGRSKRYAMVIDNGVVKTENVEEKLQNLELSAAESILKGL